MSLRRAIKWPLMALAAVLAMLAMLAVAVELISWNFLKPRIAERVESATGRALEIDGNVDLALLPRPGLTLHDVALANPDWAESPHFVEIDRLRVLPDLAAAITGRLALARIDIDGPRVRLIQRPDAPPNWALDRDNGAGDGGGPVPIHRLAIDDAEIRYRATGSGEAWTVRLPSLRVADDGDSSTAEGRAVFEQRELDIDAESGSLFEWGRDAGRFEGRVEIASADGRVEAAFSLEPAAPLAHWEVRFDVEIDDVERLASPIFDAAASTDIGSLSLAGALSRSGAEWALSDFTARALDSSLDASIDVDAAEHPASLGGWIQSEGIDVASIVSTAQRVNPPGDRDPPNGGVIGPPPVLPALDGGIDVEISRLRGLPMPVEQLSTRLVFGEHGVSVRGLTANVAGGTVTGSAGLTSAPEAVSARVSLTAEALRPGAQEDGPSLAGVVDADLRPVDRDGFGTMPMVRQLAIDTARVEYSAPASGTSLTAGVRLDEETRPVIEVAGALGGRPLQARIEGGPILAADSLPGYALSSEATSNGLTLSAETTLASLIALDRFDGRLVLSGPAAAELAPWIGTPLFGSPPFRLAGRLDRRDSLWRFENLQLAMGETGLAGLVVVEAGPRPRIEATLDADRLALGQLTFADDETKTSRGDGEPGVLSALRGFDAEIDVSADAVSLNGGPAWRDASLTAALDNGRLSLERFAAAVAGGELSVDGRVDAREVPASARIEARFSDIALARVGDSFAALEERLGRLSGAVRVDVTETLAEQYRDDIVAPMIGRLTVAPSELRFTDAEADTDLRLSAQTDRPADGEQRFSVTGEGRYDGAPFSLAYRGDALLAARLPDRPYAVDLDATVVETRVDITGSVLRPLSLAGLDLELGLSGPNPQRLSRLLGLPLPELPPYDVAGKLALADSRWQLSELAGTVGDSDIDGRLALDAAADPPRVTGALHSRSLDFDDLGGLVGATPAAGEGETASPEQRAAARRADDRFVLPQQPFIGEAWGRVRADVRYRADAVRAGDVPLSDLAIDFRLVDSTAKLAPVRFGVGDGDIDFTLNLDGSQQPPSGTMTVEVRGVDLRKALADWDLADDSIGVVGAQGKFWIAGASIAELLGSADGGLVLLMTEGRLAALMVELAGLDAGQAFISWLGGRPGIPINCAYADLQARDGSVALDTFVIDTDDTIFTAGGNVDFSAERLDVSVVAHPQDASALVGRTPFHLGGTFADVDTGLHGGALGLRVGASAGLAALAGPLAAALPLLDVGIDDRTGYCEGLVERTRGAIRTEGSKP
jgi:hypothetical protein